MKKLKKTNVKSRGIKSERTYVICGINGIEARVGWSTIKIVQKRPQKFFFFFHIIKYIYIHILIKYYFIYLHVREERKSVTYHLQ